jgi:hypothetical protein
MLAVLLSFLAMTATIDSFVLVKGRGHRRRLIPTTRTPVQTPTDLLPLPTLTSLGYEHDKTFETNVDQDIISDQKSGSTPTCPFIKPDRLSQAAKTRSAIQKFVNFRYRGSWYDVTKWRKAHSAGSHWLDWFDGRDATEIIDALHSTHSRVMATRLPKAKPAIAAELEAKATPDSRVQKNFRKLFDNMISDGWWERDMKFEYQQLGIWASLVFGALATIKKAPIVSIVLLAFSFTGAGWLGHDYVHGLDPFAKKLRLFLPLTTGLSPRWWSDKHNKHHALSKFSFIM